MTVKKFESREEADAWLATLAGAVQLGGQCRKDNEGITDAVIRFADRLTAAWAARGGNDAFATAVVDATVTSDPESTPR